MPIQTRLASWHALQPDVTPLWIMAPVGTGVPKSVPGAVRLALAGTANLGMLVRWQVSQVVEDGMCAPAPIGLVAGMPTMRAMPAKLAGVLAAWQFSQAVEDGMCEPAPGGLVGGMPTMRAMPAKLPALPEAWWQATQLLVTPAWLIKAPEKRAPSLTGRALIDEPGPTWQVSHEAVVGM